MLAMVTEITKSIGIDQDAEASVCFLFPGVGALRAGRRMLALGVAWEFDVVVGEEVRQGVPPRLAGRIPFGLSGVADVCG